MNIKQKGRYWACVGYPESLPTNWLEILQSSGLAVAISPLHDKDIDPTGEPKKPHYHLLLCYDGPTTYNNVKNLCDSLNATIPIKIESPRGMYRYHIHLDNPEKYQYSDKDRIIMNGLDPASFNGLTDTEIFKIKCELVDIIRQNRIFEYSNLIDYLKALELKDFLDVAFKNTVFLNTYLTSVRNSVKSQGRT